MSDDHPAGTATLEEPEVEHAPAAAGGEGHIHLPPNSLWPITMAFGITLAAAGLVTNLFVTVPGVLIFAWAIYGWIQELLHTEHEHE